MRSILYIIILLLLGVTSLQAQRRKPAPRGAAGSKSKSTRVEEPAPHQLLWEITGPGIEKPSYLYGTMHVQDKRAFEFSDSVLARFHECTSFAAEMRLDSAIRKLFEEYLQDDESEEENEDGYEDEGATDYASVDTVVTIEEIPTYDTAYEVSEPATPADTSGYADYTAADTADYSSFGATDTATTPAPSADDESSFMEPPPPVDSESDYNLENAPMGVPDNDSNDPSSDDSPSYSSFESMSRRRASLKDNPIFSGVFDSQTPHRMSDKPVFLDAWLTALALREGKQVIGLETMDEQLEAAKSLQSAFFGMFNPPKRKRRGLELDPDDMIVYYRAGDLEKLSLLLNQVLPEEAYNVMIVERNKKMAERAEGYIRSGPTFIAVGAGHLPGSEGVIQLLRDRGFTLRPVAATFTGLADRYTFPPRNAAWASFSSEKGAFTVQMPMEPVKLPLVEADRLGGTRNGNTFIWPDLLTGLTFSVSYSDFTSEIRPNASEVLDNIYQDRIGSVLRAIDTAATVTVDGMRGLEFQTKEYDGRYRRTRLLMHNGRIFTLSVEGAREVMTSEDAGQFFDSFHLAPLPEPEWRVNTIPWCECSLEAPGELRRDRDPYYSPGLEVGLYSHLDPVRGYMYHLDVMRYSKYFHMENADSLIAMRALYDSDTGEAPGIGLHPVVRNGIMGMEFSSPRERITGRTRLIPAADRLYELQVHMASDAFDSLAVERFFNSFVPSSDHEPIDIYSDKSDAILNALTSSDTADVHAATRALWSYRLTRNNLPRLYELLSRPWDDDEEEQPMRGWLYSALGDIRDTSSIAFIREQYPSIRNLPTIRDFALGALMKIDSDDALATFAELMARSVTADEDPDFSGFFYDFSADRGAKLYPAILGLMKSEENRHELYRLTAMLLDSGRLSRDLLLPYADQILDDCTESLGDLKEAQKSSEKDEDGDGQPDFNYELYTIAGHLRADGELLGYLPNSPRVENLLRAMMNADDKSVAAVGVKSYLRHGGTPAKSVLNRIASERFSRLDLYRILDAAGQAALFPSQHRSQRAFAESLLYEWFSDADEDIDTIVFVAQRMVNEGEHPGRIYLFKFRVPENNIWYTAISGPQPLDESAVSTATGMVYSDYEKLNAHTIDEHFDRMMKKAGK